MLSSCGQEQSPQQDIFFLCAAEGEGLLPERAVNVPNHALLSLNCAHNPGVNIIPTRRDWPDRVLRQVRTQLQLRVVQKADQLRPLADGILSSFAQCAAR